MLRKLSLVLLSLMLVAVAGSAAQAQHGHDRQGDHGREARPTTVGNGCCWASAISMDAPTRTRSTLAEITADTGPSSSAWTEAL